MDDVTRRIVQQLSGTANNPMAQYMGDESEKWRTAANAGAYGGAGMAGASLGAAPASGGLSLLGLPPAMLALVYSAMANNKKHRAMQGQDMWSQSDMPGSPHDPGIVPGGGRREY